MLLEKMGIDTAQLEVRVVRVHVALEYTWHSDRASIKPRSAHQLTSDLDSVGREGCSLER